MSSTVELKNLTKIFSSRDDQLTALKNIDLAVEQGDIYGIIGMSGAGKSTLIRCINFLEQPTEGTVLVDGCDLSELDEKGLRKVRRDIAMIFQNFNLLMQRTVLDNVCFPLEITGMKKKDARKRAMELLEIVGLKGKAKAYPAQLSGGQKQRTAIARALAGDPKILLCDEATSALDPTTTQSILELLEDINHKFGITIILITHEMSVIRQICSHVAVIEEGSLVEQGEVEKVFSNPQTNIARQLFGEKGGKESGS